jgi:hypothetical protein
MEEALMFASKRVVLALALFVFAPIATLAADAIAVDGATVQPAGPEAGRIGTKNLDILGRDYGNDASFGIMEFEAWDLTLGRIQGVESLTVSLTQTVQSYSSPGMLRICIFLANDLNLSAENPEIFFDSTEMMGLGVQGSGGYPRYEMADLEYMPGATGDVDTFTFNIPPGSHIEKILAKQINTGGVIRICCCPMEMDGNEDVAATYAGFGHPNHQYRPTLSIVPR